MGFQTGLSGLNAATKNLDVIGNNIANANTTGAKLSRAEFSEVIASTIGTGGSSFAGIGVDVAAVSQQFTQGNITVTGSELDIAINGNGFFPLIPATTKNGEEAKHALYTRAGIFKLTDQGFVVTNAGNKLFGKDLLTGIEGPLRLPTTKPSEAHATGIITAEFNVDGRVLPTDKAPHHTTSITTYDSVGNPIEAKLNLTKLGVIPPVPPATQAATRWQVAVPNPTATPAFSSDTVVAWMDFDSSGQLIRDPATNSPAILDPATGTLFPLDPTTNKPQIPTISLLSPDKTVGANGVFTTKLDLQNISQYSTAFGVSNLTQDGYPSGSFTGLKIAEGGIITARYSNGQSQDVGQIELVDFRNVQGLKPIGGGNWIPTIASGEPALGKPAENKFGALRSGALEDSNIDLTAELVNMMTAQRAYQANMQTIKTQDQALSALTQLR